MNREQLTRYEAVAAAVEGISDPAEAVEVLETRDLWLSEPPLAVERLWRCHRCNWPVVPFGERDRYGRKRDDKRAERQHARCKRCLGYYPSTPDFVPTIIAVASLGRDVVMRAEMLAVEIGEAIATTDSRLRCRSVLWVGASPRRAEHPHGWPTSMLHARHRSMDLERWFGPWSKANRSKLCGELASMGLTLSRVDGPFVLHALPVNTYQLRRVGLIRTSVEGSVRA